MVRPAEPFQHRFFYLLLPGLLQGGLSILVLPLVTLILTPEDYGVFALVTGVTGAGAALAALGSSFIMAHRFQPTVSADRGGVVSTVLTLVVGAAVVLAALIVGGFLSFGTASTLVTSLPLVGLSFALLDMVASCGWSVATSVAVLSRNTRAHAILTSIRAVAVQATVLTVLFGLHVHGPMALFAGVAAGGCVSAVGTWIVVRPYLRPAFDRQIAREMLSGGGWLGLANFVEMLEKLVERWALASFVGVRATGLLNHAQIYPNTLMMGVRPALQSAWPNLCEEAREPRPYFPRGRHLVRLISLGISVASLSLALVGQEMIGLLTHGSFVEAAPYAAILAAVAGLRIAGRPQHAVLVANGHAAVAALVNGLSALTGVLLVIAFVPIWGLPGAVAALVGYALVYLALLHHLSRRIRSAPILDVPALCGFGATVLVVWGVVSFQPSLPLRLGMAMLVCVVGAWVAVMVVRRSGLLHMLASKRRSPSVVGH